MEVPTYTFSSWLELKEFVEHQPNIDKLEPGDRILLRQQKILNTDLPRDFLWMYAGKDKVGTALFTAIEDISGDINKAQQINEKQNKKEEGQ